LRCETCGKFFPGKHGLSKHISHYHRTGKFDKIPITRTKSKNKFSCEICYIAFQTPSKLKKHQYTHGNKIRDYSWNFSINRSVSFSDNTSLKCNDCGFICTGKNTLITHSYQYKHNFTHKCFCGQSFFTYRGLELHTKKYHFGDRSSFTNILSKSVENATKPKKAQSLAKSESSLPYKCDKCDAKFNALRCLSYHKVSRHDGMIGIIVTLNS
jgi:hypothetical protein